MRRFILSLFLALAALPTYAVVGKINIVSNCTPVYYATTSGAGVQLSGPFWKVDPSGTAATAPSQYKLAEAIAGHSLTLQTISVITSASAASWNIDPQTYIILPQYNNSYIEK